MTQTQIIDLNTTDGIIEHLKSLPTENVKALAARPVYDTESARWGFAADAILALRGE